MIIKQLAKLAELAPEVCQITVPFSGFAIGEYSFWPKEDVFVAQHSGKAITGRPALAWLRDAVEQAIETRGWYWELHYWKPKGKYKGEVANRTAWADNPAEALLAAFVAALESEE